ncbi:MAG: ATP-binding cassette domain-containing protein [Candidatus Alcyoniella australis]|nr:ATP-binding cassette domain-containing protein [Candidatus Alcyoniella australis]
MAAILDIRDLNVELGGQTILDRVSFKVERSSIHALIGPNGAGKTTVIRSILGGMPHRGSIVFHSNDGGWIGHVPQLLEFDRSLPITVADFIMISLRRKPCMICRHSTMRMHVSRVLERMECAHLADRLLGGLSGGELRRVLLAQALEPLPEMLLLDEPTSSIDEHGARLLENRLARLCSEQGVTILMVAHDIAQILRIADHVTAINRTVTYDGGPERLRDPQHLGLLFGIEGRANDAPVKRELD